MKSRIESLESKNPTPETDIEKLEQCAGKWWEAVRERDWKSALKARQAAEPLFEQKPEWLENVPSYNFRKVICIDWKYFAGFTRKTTRNEYIKIITK